MPKTVHFKPVAGSALDRRAQIHFFTAFNYRIDEPDGDHCHWMSTNTFRVRYTNEFIAELIFGD